MRHFLVAAAATAAISLAAVDAMASATIQYPSGRTFLLVNEQGHLNGFPNSLDPAFPNPLPVISNPFAMGLFYDGVGDGTVDGCLCEGWGASANFTGAGFTSMGASVDNGGVSGLSGTVQFGATASTAFSQVSSANSLLSVTHEFGPSIAFDVFQVNVTITNNSASEIAQDIVYRRIMDWDIQPTPFDEFVTIQGVEANLEVNGGNVRRAVDNGFDAANPGFGQLTPINEPINTDFHDSGPNDHGAGFDFAFGDLAPGESRNFNIFYGATPNQAQAEAAVNTLGLDVWSFGQSNPLGLPYDGGPCDSPTPPAGCGDGGGGVVALSAAAGPTPAAVPGEANPVGEPATFLFGFGGVGGSQPGDTAFDPILPFAPTPGTSVFTFDNPVPGRWYDPPSVDAYSYELIGDPTAFFSLVEVPPAGFGFDPITLEIDGIEIATLMAGDSFDFFANGYTDVQSFILKDISPLIDLSTAAFAFPVFLDFTGSPLQLEIEALVASGGPSTGVSEPGVFALVGAGMLALVVVRRRRQA